MSRKRALPYSSGQRAAGPRFRSAGTVGGWGLEQVSGESGLVQTAGGSLLSFLDLCTLEVKRVQNTLQTDGRLEKFDQNLQRSTFSFHSSGRRRIYCRRRNHNLPANFIKSKHGRRHKPRGCFSNKCRVFAELKHLRRHRLHKANLRPSLGVVRAQ